MRFRYAFNAGSPANLNEGRAFCAMTMELGSARALLQRTRNSLFPGALILLYHRVGEPEFDPQLLSVSRRNFEEHLQVLRKFGTTSLDSLLASGRTYRAAIALTFDDGYGDNLWNAKPLLEKYETPATVFVSVGHVVGRRPYWWDELEQLLRPNPLPGTLSVTIGGVRRQWAMEDTDVEQAAHPRNADWNVLAASDPSPRQAAYLELCAAVRELPPSQQETIIDEVRAAFSVSYECKCAACTPDEIRRLREPGLIDIGAHTCTHPMLSRLSVGEQQQEISRSKELLEEILGNPIEAFSYPYGGRSDYGEESVDCVRRSGFRLACSNFEGHVRASTDPYQLPRYLVRNWDGETFARYLKRWFHA
jgi:peptidoglycan/xylan/chitin deacetylase (PgdA/CDA1 family)